MTTKEKIISTTSKEHGGFVNTDGAWCMTRTPAQFAAYLERMYGFEIIDCKSDKGSTAIAITSDGLMIAWNGYCKRITK